LTYSEKPFWPMGRSQLLARELTWPLSHKPRKIYIAASLNNQIRAMRLAIDLMRAGFEVASRWCSADFSGCPDKDSEQAEWVDYEIVWRDRDLEDIAAADVLVVLTDVSSKSGGLHFELGWWIGSDRSGAIIVGTRKLNCFFLIDDVQHVASTADLLEWLSDESHGSKTASISIEDNSPF
jgi:hypothetical protein